MLVPLRDGKKARPNGKIDFRMSSIPTPPEAKFTISISDRIVRYSENGAVLVFEFDRNTRQGSNALFLHTKPYGEYGGRTIPAIVEEKQLEVIIERVSAWMSSRGGHITIIRETMRAEDGF